MSRVERRVACIALPEIRIEVVRAKERLSEESGNASSAAPLAVVVAGFGAAVKTERDVLGSTRIDVVSAEAGAFGVRAGQTVAAARAKCADLRVRVIAREAVRSTLARVAETALAWGPTVAFSDEEDVVWVEIGGCAHLEGGEQKLAEALGKRVFAMGHACRIAIAGGPRIASAVARWAPSRKALEGGQERRIFIVPQGKQAAAVRVLPVAAIAIDGDTSAWLRSLGLRLCGDLQKLPRRSFGIRLGSRANEVLQFLDGEDRAPLDAWRPPEIPEERIELDWGAASIEALAFVMKTLCERLGARLEGRALAAARIEIILGMDRGLYERAGKEMPPISTIDVTLPSPVMHGADLFAIVRARLDRETVAAPVVSVTLRASELANASAHCRDMFAPEPKAFRALPGLVSELTAELGETSLGTLALGDTWVTHERTRLQPFGASNPTPRHSLVTSALEPSRLISPFFVPRARLAKTELLGRIEAVQWWRIGTQRRDFVAAWIPMQRDRDADVDEGGDPGDEHRNESKRRVAFANARRNTFAPARENAGAHAWVEISDQRSDARLRGWID